MIYKQINNISKKEIKKKLNKFFNEDNIKNDITTNTFVDKKKNIKLLGNISVMRLQNT